jgi:hypothetical protein
MSFGLKPTSQLAMSAGDDMGPIDYRRRTQQTTAIASVSFRFLNDQYKVFLAWWQNTLLYGHKWFTINLPSARGNVTHYARFATKFIASKRGFRYIEVTAELELRERQIDAPIVIDAPVDPFREQVIFHLQGFGVNNATSFVDVGPLALPITTLWGSPKLSNGQSKWGPPDNPNSTSFLGDTGTGAVNLQITTPFSASMRSTTIETWLYRNQSTFNYAGFLAASSGNSVVGIVCPNNGASYEFGVVNPFPAHRTNSVVPVGSWVFLEIGYNLTLNQTFIFFNGVLEKTVAGNILWNISGTTYIGVADSAFFSGMPFYLQDLRVTAVCRNTSSYAVPDAPFPIN